MYSVYNANLSSFNTFWASRGYKNYSIEVKFAAPKELGSKKTLKANIETVY